MKSALPEKHPRQDYRRQDDPHGVHLEPKRDEGHDRSQGEEDGRGEPGKGHEGSTHQKELFRSKVRRGKSQHEQKGREEVEHLHQGRPQSTVQAPPDVRSSLNRHGPRQSLPEGLGLLEFLLRQPPLLEQGNLADSGDDGRSAMGRESHPKERQNHRPAGHDRSFPVVRGPSPKPPLGEWGQV